MSIVNAILSPSCLAMAPVVAWPTVETFLDRFDQVCRDYGSATAIVHGETCYTYHELDRWANRIANHLLSLDPTPHQHIGLCLDRSAGAIAAMIGIMRSRNAFVPLDPAYPVERLRYMVEDARVRRIICDAPYRSLFADPTLQLQILCPADEVWNSASDRQPKGTILGEDLAYIMYTSGSTGNPKGVEIEHRALATYCAADVEIYQLTAADRTLQFSTLNFDIAIEEIFPPLMVGSTVVVRPLTRSASDNELSAIIREFKITALHCATAYWHEWVDLMHASHDAVPESLRMVLATGEKVSPAHYHRWKSLCRHQLLWCNAYGPTETTVTATVFIPEPDWDGDNMPIGKPLKGYTAYILNSVDRPVQPGETGDLYIGGPALARGYLNLPERTSLVFRTISLPDQMGIERSTRVYKTGDLARWLPSGDIEYAGRIDHQIKLGSYRIEPGEIEYHISSHARVLESLVTHSDVDGKKALIAYVATGSNAVTAAELAEYLRDCLPSYMIPSRYCFVDAFPKTINGKIDRQRLPDPATGEVPRQSDFESPRNAIETMLVELWEQVLGVSGIGIHDDFFTIGGSSLLVTRVIAGIRREYDLAIPVRDFFANPTIASIAALLTKQLGGAVTAQPDEAAGQRIRQRMPDIDAFFYPVGNEQLFVIRYVPRKFQPGNRCGLLICHADGHEYVRASRNVQQMAMHFAKSGLDVMRFDFSACGNSSGVNSDGQVDTWKDELRSIAAMYRARADIDHLTVLAVRLGALIVQESLDGTSDQAPYADRVIYWDPVQSGRGYLSMLDAFQHQNLSSMTDFPVRRRTDVAQTFGLELPICKRQSYERLEFHPDPLIGTQGSGVPLTIVTSANYCQVEGLHLNPSIPLFETCDEIRWHEFRYCNTAFASPEIAATLGRLLGVNAR
ncbi:MAG: amino acid adenylation domain-containing protein [Pirellulaceae bacterium]|nr:amino acid adenylation domain-containing protein [Pirellulaceae bacterium]